MNKYSKEKIDICHLIKFDLAKPDSLKIDERFRIREVSINECRDFYVFIRQSYRSEFRDYRLTRFCIESTDEKKSNEFPVDVSKLIISMSLFSGKAITQGVIIIHNSKEPDKPFKLINSLDCYGEPWEKISAEEIKKFSEFWEIIKKSCVKINEVEFRYFKETMQAFRMEDRIIKMTIAMEKILLPNESLELSNKISTRAAFILSDKYEQRKEIYDCFKDMYKERSKIVHGEVEKTKLTREEFKKYFDYCREIICLYIENKKCWNSKLEDISLGKNVFEGENSLNRNLADLMLKE